MAIQVILTRFHRAVVKARGQLERIKGRELGCNSTPESCGIVKDIFPATFGIGCRGQSQTVIGGSVFAVVLGIGTD